MRANKQAALPASPEREVTLQRGGTPEHPAREGERDAGSARAARQSRKPGLRERLSCTGEAAGSKCICSQAGRSLAVPPAAQLLHAGARKTGQQQPVPPLPHRPGKGIAGFLGHRCRKGKKDEPSPPRLHPSPAGWAGPEEPVPEQMPVGRSQHPAARLAGKLGWREGGEIGMEGERIHHKAQSFSVQSTPYRLGATGTNSGELISGK